MRILLGVGGGIAAFKAAALCSKLVQDGHDVRVAMSRGASAFIGPVTFEGLTGRAVISSSTQVDPDGRVPHVTDARDADVFVVVPATADLMARLAAGACDDPVALAAVSCRGRRIVCPAMNDSMWEAPATQRNLQTLHELGYEVLGPAEGWLAEGYRSVGRMVEPEEIAAAIVGVAVRVRFRMTGEAAALEAAMLWLHLHREVVASVEQPGETDVVCDGPIPTADELAGGLQVEELPLDDGRDWTGRENDAVVEVLDDLWVRPPWVPAPLDREGVELVVPRGGAFGSGEAESTKSILRLQHRVWDEVGVASFADVGCGSGILSLYAQVRGAVTVNACDIEDGAVLAATELLDAEAGGKVFAGGPEILPSGVHDLVAANLGGPEFQPVVEAVRALARPGGVLLIGGLKDHEVQPALDALAIEPFDEEKGGAFTTFAFRLPG